MRAETDSRGRLIEVGECAVFVVMNGQIVFLVLASMHYGFFPLTATLSILVLLDNIVPFGFFQPTGFGNIIADVRALRVFASFADCSVVLVRPKHFPTTAASYNKTKSDMSHCPTPNLPCVDFRSLRNADRIQQANRTP